MKLSISNIAWSSEDDSAVFQIMHCFDFTGLEIAPTRIFPERPYSQLSSAKKWSKDFEENEGFSVPSMQSIWYGRNEIIFGSEEERAVLVDYTKKAIDFAETIGCKNLVFGCPRNRNKPKDADEEIAVDFFKTIGKYAAQHNTVVGMEANPPIYNTNYINDTKSALDLIEEVGSDGFKLNLDVGTMIANEEDVSVLSGRENYINHVHISEPRLKPIQHRDIHKKLADYLRDAGYDKFVSIEVGKQENINMLADMMKYVKEIFG